MQGLVGVIGINVDFTLGGGVYDLRHVTRAVFGFVVSAVLLFDCPKVAIGFLSGPLLRDSLNFKL